MISQERLKQIIEDYRNRLAATLGDELDSIVVYGSQARQEAVEASDIDVLCVMSKPFRYGDLINRTSKDTAEISLKYDVVISRVFVTRKAYESRCSPFLNECTQRTAGYMKPDFGREYTKTGIMDSRFHRRLIDAQDFRNIGDYGVEAHVLKDDANSVCQWASEFIDQAENFLLEDGD